MLKDPNFFFRFYTEGNLYIKSMARVINILFGQFFNSCLSFFTFFNAKPPSLDLVGEIVHGSTDLLSMSRWGGGGTPLVQMLRQKKDTHRSAGCPFWRTSFTKQHLQLPFMSFLLLCQSH